MECLQISFLLFINFVYYEKILTAARKNIWRLWQKKDNGNG